MLKIGEERSRAPKMRNAFWRREPRPQGYQLWGQKPIKIQDLIVPFFHAQKGGGIHFTFWGDLEFGNLSLEQSLLFHFFGRKFSLVTLLLLRQFSLLIFQDVSYQ